MKLKSSIKEKAKAATEDLINRSLPVVDKPAGKLRKWTQQHPLASLTIMFTIVILNVGFLYFFTNTFSPVSLDLKSVKQKITDSLGTVNDMGIPFSFKNYREMLSIRDSLEYLITKPNRTASDTALAMRLFKKMETLDPGFFNRIKNLHHEKNSITK